MIGTRATAVIECAVADFCKVEPPRNEADIQVGRDVLLDMIGNGYVAIDEGRTERRTQKSAVWRLWN